MRSCAVTMWCRSRSQLPIYPEGWPVMHPDAYHGIVGRIVKQVEPYTESDPNAILLQLLVGIGNVAGRRLYLQIESDRHYGLLYLAIVGQTSKARKGTSLSRVLAHLQYIDQTWACNRIGHGGLSSGEGFISLVRDPVMSLSKKGEMIMSDQGEDDKRYLVTQSELAGMITVMSRSGNTLSDVMRAQWDCPPVLHNHTKQSQLKATEPFVSLLGHITLDELRRTFGQTECGNGFANRFLWAVVFRSKRLSRGGRGLADRDIEYLGKELDGLIHKVRKGTAADMTQAAWEMWDQIYDELSEGKGGIIGKVTDRAEAQVIRLAVIYALCDGMSVITVEHLKAALAVWRFCEASATFIFEGMTGDNVQDTIFKALVEQSPDWLSRTAISNLFGRNVSSNAIAEALGKLLVAGKAIVREDRTKPARPVEYWQARLDT